MKRAYIVPGIWLGNVALMAVVIVALWQAHANARAERRAVDARVAAAGTSEPRIEWQSRLDPQGPGVPDIRLSPLAREKPPEPVIVEEPVVIPEKTAAQRKAELATALNRRFAVMRLMLADGDELSYALVMAGGRSLLWHEGLDLQAAYAEARSTQLRTFAMDVKVLRVDETGVLVDAAGIERPDERFEVHLKLRESAPSSLMFARGND